MFRPLLVAIFRWFVIQKIQRQLLYMSTDPLLQYVQRQMPVHNKTSTDICCVRRFLHLLDNTHCHLDYKFVGCDTVLSCRYQRFRLICFLSPQEWTTVKMQFFPENAGSVFLRNSSVHQHEFANRDLNYHHCEHLPDIFLS
jgi:hypothetical protein